MQITPICTPTSSVGDIPLFHSFPVVEVCHCLDRSAVCSRAILVGGTTSHLGFPASDGADPFSHVFGHFRVLYGMSAQVHS